MNPVKADSSDFVILDEKVFDEKILSEMAMNPVMRGPAQEPILYHTILATQHIRAKGTAFLVDRGRALDFDKRLIRDFNNGEESLLKGKERGHFDGKTVQVEDDIGAF